MLKENKNTLYWLEWHCQSLARASLSRSHTHTFLPFTLPLSATQLSRGLPEVKHRAQVSFHDYTVSIQSSSILSKLVNIISVHLAFTVGARGVCLWLCIWQCGVASTRVLNVMYICNWFSLQSAHILKGVELVENCIWTSAFYLYWEWRATREEFEEEEEGKCNPKFPSTKVSLTLFSSQILSTIMQDRARKFCFWKLELAVQKTLKELRLTT